jgi:Tfp pilus assembly protein PilO
MSAVKRDQRLLIHACGLVVAGGACLLLYVGLIMPLDNKRAQLRDDRKAYELAKREIVNTQRTLASDQSSIAEMHEKLRDAVQLTADTRLNSRLGEVSSLVDRQGVAISSVRPGEPVRTAHYTATPINIDADGTYGQFIALLDALHSDARDIEVRSFEIAGEPGPTSPTLDIKLQLTWFALPNVVPAPANSSTARAQ